jgi:spore coat polysaccharide biosynthesis protein SpsF
MAAMKVLAVLQARTTSRRLPQKVLLPLAGKPMLARQIERIRRARYIDELLVATSVDPSDDSLETLCEREAVACFRGSLDDVLDRFYRAAATRSPEHVVRLTGDCPLTDPAVIDQTIELYLQGGFDYASNALEPTFPDGLDVEVFRFACLEAAWRDAKSLAQREHVTLFIYQNPDRFRTGCYRNKTNLAQLRWTVDEPQDYEFVKQVYEALYPANPHFTMHDVLRFSAQHPEASAVNRGIERNEGLARALQREERTKT